MRDAFVRTLIELAKKDRNIELVTGDVGFGVLKPFWEQLPNQFTNAGIAEQNMTTVAAGMAMCGKIVYTYSIGNFSTLRCLEQIRNDCAYHHANVKIVCVGGGLGYGPLGMSHQATEDIAILRSLPGLTVVCPGDLIEAEEATRASVHINGTVYLRLGRGGEKRIHEKIENFRIGKAIKIRDALDMDRKVALFSTGAILDEASDACEILENDGFGVEQYSFHTIKPIDKNIILSCADKYNVIVTIEEHTIVGGFGSAVSEVLTEEGSAVKLFRVGVNDSYCSLVGAQKYLREQFGMNSRAIAERIKGIFNE